ncbi:MAG: hypothetical protein ACOY93_06485 [Bacillota bacterium]
MDLPRRNRGYGLLLLLVLGYFLFRTFSEGNPEVAGPEVIAAHREEMAYRWTRIPPFPGSEAPEPLMEESAERILWERLQPSAATYEEARTFYDEALGLAGWERIGETREVPGFAGPIYLYRSRSYTLFLSKEAEGILLRMTWSLQPELLIDVRVKR